MNIDSISSTVTILAFRLFIVVQHLALGITEAIILSHNAEAKNACGPSIWGCILMCCIIHFILATFNGNARNEKPGDDKGNSLLYLASLASSIWACVCYFNTDTDCVNLFDNSFHTLWKMVQVEMIIFFISLVVFAVCCVIACYCINTPTNTRTTVRYPNIVPSAPPAEP
jgi:hypothetical protein